PAGSCKLPCPLLRSLPHEETMTEPSKRCQLRWLPWLLALLPTLAAADVVDSVNSVRSAGCPGGTRSQPLRRSLRLDEVARRLAGGASIHSAQQQAGYHAVGTFSVAITDVPESGDVRQVIVRQFCAQATNPAFREIGLYQKGSDVWVALAAP